MDFNNQSSANSTKEIFKWVGLGLVSLGTLLTFIFSIVVCARGKAVKDGIKTTDLTKKCMGTSLWIIGVIIAVIIVIAGLILAILSIEKGQQMSKVVIVTIAVGACALIYAAFTNITICSYGCTINCKYKKDIKKIEKQYSINMSDYLN